MRKTIFCCIFAILLLLSSCTHDPSSNIEETENTTNADSSTETTGTLTKTIADIQLTHRVHHVEHLSNDTIDYVYSLLKNGKWEEGALIKMSGDYIFVLRNGGTISYSSDIGAINDETNNRYLELTDEQKNTLNELLKP